jgi:hypothetical protein
MLEEIRGDKRVVQGEQVPGRKTSALTKSSQFFKNMQQVQGCNASSLFVSQCSRSHIEYSVGSCEYRRANRKEVERKTGGRVLQALTRFLRCVLRYRVLLC